MGKNSFKWLAFVIGIFLFGLSTTTQAAIYSASNMVGHVNQNGVLVYTAGGSNNGPNNAGFNYPGETLLDPVNHRLFVADQNNARVLVFTLDSTNNFTTSTPAYVLGQSNFFSASTTAAQTNLAYPDGLALDPVSSRLFVSDQVNNRVLIFNVATSTIASGENALNVLGQSNFSASSSATAQNGLSAPYGLAYDASSSRLFIADQGNNRILVFNVATSTIANGENASSVIGQAAFNTSSSATAQNGLATPYDLAFDSSGKRLFVADAGNNRVLYFNVATSTIANGENASSVIGQAAFNTSSSATAQNGLSAPYGLAYDAVGDRLFVADNGNNRVLAFAVGTSSFASNENASSVIGEPDFLSSGPNTAQNGLSSPFGLAYDSTNGRLFVGDQGNNRVMLFAAATGTISNGENASTEIGELDTNSNPLYTANGTNGGPSAEGFNNPQSAVVDTVNHRLFIADQNNNRVLVFPLNASDTLSGTTASYVIGQPNFISFAATTTQNGLSAPYGLEYDSINQRLFVADQNNNRVLVFNVATSTIANGENASYVLGQSDFVSSEASTSPTSLDTPEGLAYDASSSRLFVADTTNNRILVFDASTSTIFNGESALYVLGQGGFYTGDADTTQNSFSGPAGIAYDGGSERLFVADVNNNRVLVFDVSTSTLASNSTSTAANALHILGQSDYMSSDSNTSQTGFNGPFGVAYDSVNNRLFVADENNSRIMIFPAATSSLSDNEDASNVLGAADFATAGGGTSQNAVNFDDDIAYDPINTKLFGIDPGNNRVMEYSFVTITTPSLPTGTVGSAYSNTIAATSTQGSVTFSLVNGSLPPGLALASSTGVISGTPTSATTTTFTVQASDTFSTGVFTKSASYSLTINANAPGAPTGVSAVAGNANATITFSAPASTGGSPILFYRATSNPGGISATSTVSPISVSGLGNGTSYTFTVTATNAIGTSASSSASNSVTPSGLAPFITSFAAVPSAIQPGASSTLSWSVSNASSVSIIPGSFSTSTLIGSLIVAPTSTTTYTLTASSKGNGTSTDASTVIVDGIAPSVPTSVVATAASASEIDLTWATSTDSGGSGLAGYDVYRNGIKIATTSVTNYADTGLSAGTSYNYYLDAFDFVGNVSATSTLASATTQNSSGGGGGGGGGSSGGGGGGGGGGSSYIPPVTTATGSVSSTGSSTTPSSSESTLAALLAELEALLNQLNAIIVKGFTRNLTIGSVGQDVQNLQIFLNDNGYTVATSGSGSPGNESSYFGAKTATALAKFQAAHSLPATGYLGPLTRSFLQGTFAASAPTAAFQNTSTVTSPATATSSSAPPLYPSLSLGDTGSAVKTAQQLLIQDGYLSAASITSGVFDVATLRAVETFQCLQNIVCAGTPATTGYGNIGSRTWAKLNGD